MNNWQELNHAYGSAGDMPALLAELAFYPIESSYEAEPWFSLWSALCHQGDIYSASFVAVPEIVKHLANNPQKATFSFFALPASIEIARVKGNIAVPAEFDSSYFQAIRTLGQLAATWANSTNNTIVSQSAIAAFAVSVGQIGYAELVLQIPPEDISEVFDWYWER
ncbi:hypothetical protein ACWLOZ_004290 [Vibrio parahaemolyticus]